MIESSWRIASRPDWPRPEEALGLLRDHIAVDFESLAVDAFRNLLDRAGRQAPEDDRVWLGWANLAIRNGQFAERGGGSMIASARRPEDPGGLAGRARLGPGDRTGRCGPPGPAHLPAERFSRGGVDALRAWLASRRHDAETERRALEQLVQDEPGQFAALERLAVLAAQAGRVEEAGVLRRRKSAMDQARQRYRTSTIRISSPTMRRSWPGWPRPWASVRSDWLLDMDHAARPDDHAARTALARLQGEANPSRRAAANPCSGPCRRTCRRGGPTFGGRRAPANRPPPQFRDDAQAAGLSFDYENGESSIHQLPEFTGGGVGLIDYDGDGWLDVYLVQGGRFPPIPLNLPGATACSATAATGRSRT